MGGYCAFGLHLAGGMPIFNASGNCLTWMHKMRSGPSDLMSTPSGIELDLEFLPAWAREPADANRFAKYEGGPEQDKRGQRDRFGRRHERGGGDRAPRRDRPQQDSHRPLPAGPDRRKDRPRRGREGGQKFRERGREQSEEAPEPQVQLPEIDVEFIPDELGVESLAKQIKLRGRAYPLFDIALLILRAPERYQARFVVRRGQDDKPLQRLVVCSLDESVWLSEDEVVDHIMRRHFAMFYQTEKVAIDPPKGTYTFVAKCGLSGAILGPPNYHDYQTKLHRLHAERFSHMPFEVYKSKVKMVRDEAVVKQWLEDQSWRLEYVGLNVPDAVRLQSREEVEQHFRSVHLANIAREVDEFVLPPGGKRPFMSRLLGLLLKQSTEDQRRFPLRLATRLSQQFAARGLQFFKVDRAVHVCVARPHYLDLQETVVSESIRRIVEFIGQHPRSTRRQLIEALAPSPTRPSSTPADSRPPEQQGQVVAGDVAAQNSQEKSVPAEPPEPTPEQTALIADLHWLIHQGHIIEFFDGHIEMARPPKPKPAPAPRTEPKNMPATTSDQPLGQAGAPAGSADKPSQQSPPSTGPAAPEQQAPAADTPKDSLPVAPLESQPKSQLDQPAGATQSLVAPADAQVDASADAAAAVPVEAQSPVITQDQESDQEAEHPQAEQPKTTAPDARD